MHVLPFHAHTVAPPPPQNARKGEFSRANVKGKRALELGAGPGLGGMALALLGADVLLTDLQEVVPLIRKNVDANLSRAASHGAFHLAHCKQPTADTAGSLCRSCIYIYLPSLLRMCVLGQGRDGPWGAQAGPVRVQVLDWGSDADIAAAGGPFSIVIAADCVYHEEHVEKLHGTMMALTDLKSTGEPPAACILFQLDSRDSGYPGISWLTTVCWF